MNYSLPACAATLLLAASILSAQSDVTIDITHIASDQGALYVGFYTPGNDFPDHKKSPFRKRIVPSGNMARVTFSDIRDGDYAVAVLHDLNDNDIHDKHFLGIPKEPYGFSNNVRPALTAPGFDACRFSLMNESKHLTIRLID